MALRVRLPVILQHALEVAVGVVVVQMDRKVALGLAARHILLAVLVHFMAAAGGRLPAIVIGGAGRVVKAQSASSGAPVEYAERHLFHLQTSALNL